MDARQRRYEAGRMGQCPSFGQSNLSCLRREYRGSKVQRRDKAAAALLGTGELPCEGYLACLETLRCFPVAEQSWLQDPEIRTNGEESHRQRGRGQQSVKIPDGSRLKASKHVQVRHKWLGVEVSSNAHQQGVTRPAPITSWATKLRPISWNRFKLLAAS